MLNYSANFYDDVKSTSDPSAKVVVPIVMEMVNPASVADVGCGSGAWIAHFAKYGCKVHGFDGPWVEDSQLLIKKEEFTRADLASGVEWNGVFDLVISLEVAEHLPESSAELFVDSLCKLSSTVLFSAAIPGQGGTNHLNEQWQSYWVKKFADRGYQCFDVIRPRIWDRNEVAVHYRQNSFIFSKTEMLGLAESPHKGVIDAVHPQVFAEKTSPLNYSIRKFLFEFMPALLKRNLSIK